MLWKWKRVKLSFEQYFPFRKGSHCHCSQDLRDTVLCDTLIYVTLMQFDTLIYETQWTVVGSGLLISVLEELNWFRLMGLIILVLLMWKWIGLFLRKNHLLRCWSWLSLLIWIGALTLSLLLKLPPRKLEPWFVLWRFFHLRLLCISINLPYSLTWNTVVMSGLALLAATLNCQISYKNRLLRTARIWKSLLIIHWPMM